jgi:hypothetical protein
MSVMLKTNTMISKWADSEIDLRRMKDRGDFPEITNIEKQLEQLYYDSLLLVAQIYKAGEKKSSRMGMFVLSVKQLSPSSFFNTLKPRITGFLILTILW